jgi:response regulator RpfG family c-di-GMP phosphodiesterase
MAPISGLEELVGYVERTTRLNRYEAARIVADVLAYFSESQEQFVRRRHSELQAQALRNPEIFERIAAELAERRFAAAALSARQIRRVVYG